MIRKYWAIASVVLLSGCGGAAAPSPAPAAPSAPASAAAASSPAASVAPAKPSQAAASPSAAGSAAPSSAVRAGPPAPSGSVKIRLGTLNNIGDEPLWAAKDKGYFAEQALDVQFIPFTNGSDELVALTTNQIDFSAGTPSAAYYNATDRGVPLKLVANLSVTNERSKSVGISVRSDLFDSGRYKTPADLKGLKIGVGSAPGTGNISDMQWERLSAKGGLTMKDLDFTVVPFPQMPAALANRAVDVAYLIEPFLSVATQQQKTARVIAYNGDLNPGYPVYMLFASQNMVDQQRPVADKFMVAVVKGLRFMYNAFNKSQNTDDALDILAGNQPIKDKELLAKQAGDVANPDTPMDLKPYQDFEDGYERAGVLKQKVALNQLIDTSFLQRAVQSAK